MNTDTMKNLVIYLEHHGALTEQEATRALQRLINRQAETNPEGAPPQQPERPSVSLGVAPSLNVELPEVAEGQGTTCPFRRAFALVSAWNANGTLRRGGVRP